MPLDPGLRAFLDFLASTGAPPMSTVPPEQARAMFRAGTFDNRPEAMVIPVASVEEIELPGPAGPLGARVYRPEAGGPTPTVLFVHGGGWVIGDLDTHDNQARRVTRETGSVVVSLDYRRAPEHPWPAAADDAKAAFAWVVEHVGELGGDAERIGVAGDSAGGNLAAVLAQYARDEGLPLRAQLLIYPGVDLSENEYPSRTENGEGLFLTDDLMRWFAAHYVGQAPDRKDPSLSPLFGRLEGLAPAVVVTGEFDPLRDEGDAYAEALAKAGVEVDHLQFPGVIHGFFDLGPVSPAVEAAVVDSCAAFRARLG